MRHSIYAALVCGFSVLPGLPAVAQSTPNPAMTAPDQVAWQLFIQANTPGRRQQRGIRNLGQRHRHVPAQSAVSDRADGAGSAAADPAADRARRRAGGRRTVARAAARDLAGRDRGNPSQQGDVRFHRAEQPVQDLRTEGGLRQESAIPDRLHRGQGELGAGQRNSGLHQQQGDARAGAAALSRQLRGRSSICAGGDARDQQAGAELDLGDLRAPVQSGPLRHHRLPGRVRRAAGVSCPRTAPPTRAIPIAPRRRR